MTIIMHIRNIAITLFLFTAMQALPQEFLSSHHNQVDDLGRKQGDWKVFDGNGNLKYVGAFRNDVPVGEFTYYYPNGKVKAVINHLPGVDVAYAVSYHPNGEKMAEGKYVNQKKDSIWNYYSDIDGALISTEVYVSRVRQGTWKTYYASGQVAEEVNYSDGLEDGPWVQYFTDGKVKAKGQYKEGKLEGLMQYFYVDGNVQISGTFKNGVKDGTWMYFNEDLESIKKEIYRNGDLISEEDLTGGD